MPARLQHRRLHTVTPESRAIVRRATKRDEDLLPHGPPMELATADPSTSRFTLIKNDLIGES